MLTQFCHVFDAMFPPSLSFPATSQSLSTTAAITTTTAAAVDVAAAAADDSAAAAITAANEDDIIECGFIEVKIEILSFVHVKKKKKLMTTVFYSFFLSLSFSSRSVSTHMYSWTSRLKTVLICFPHFGIHRYRLRSPISDRVAVPVPFDGRRSNRKRSHKI